MKSKDKDKFVGVQISPISFIDEGVDQVLNTLINRVGVNVLLIGTVSWLGLKSGRSVSWKIDGWPDHGISEPFSMKGGAYFNPDSKFYNKTFIKDFKAKDPEMKDKDILKMVIPKAREKQMKVFIELMDPFFNYAGHGSTQGVDIPNLVQCMEVDVFGRVGSSPSTSNPDYRNWILSMIEDQVANYNIDGVMWCNERYSPLDQLFQGSAPGDFSTTFRKEAEMRNVNVDKVKDSMKFAYEFFQKARSGFSFIDGTLIEFFRLLFDRPEILEWEKIWLERNKDLDKEIFGLVKWVNPKLSFGLNVWNRNHFNFIRKVQWPWLEQTNYADWVKPITYQHQSGEIFTREINLFGKSAFNEFSEKELIHAFAKILNINEGSLENLTQKGLDPDTYIYTQCKDAVRGVEGKAKVYMGIGIDAPRSSEDQAKCTPEIAYRSVKATYKAGGEGIVLSPNYSSMKLSNLDGVAKALKELDIFHNE